jgi:putative transposase
LGLQIFQKGLAVLVVDEVGYLTYGTDAANMLFHVVNDRHRRDKSMIFTPNKALKAWGACSTMTISRRPSSTASCSAGVSFASCSVLGTGQHDGDGLLSGRTGGCLSLRSIRDLELRSGLAVHRGGFSDAVEKARRVDQHGWARPCSRQRFIERLWRSLKYGLIYPGDFADGAELSAALHRYFHFYSHRRPRQALDYRTPADLFPHPAIRKE